MKLTPWYRPVKMSKVRCSSLRLKTRNLKDSRRWDRDWLTRRLKLRTVESSLSPVKPRIWFKAKGRSKCWSRILRCSQGISWLTNKLDNSMANKWCPKAFSKTWYTMAYNSVIILKGTLIGTWKGILMEIVLVNKWVVRSKFTKVRSKKRET